MSAPRATRRRENRTRYVVLGMLSRAPMTGYALRQAIACSVGHFWQESYGQLYPTLQALAAEGLLRVTEATPGRRHAARYEVTARGRGALAAWLERPPLLEPQRNELLLKVFFAGAVSPEVTARNLAAVGEVLRAQRGALEAIASGWEAKVAGHPDAPYWRLTLDFGLGFLRMASEWLDRAERVVKERAPAGAHPGRAGACAAKARRGGTR